MDPIPSYLQPCSTDVRHGPHTVVLTTLLYGCEAWTPYRRHIRRLDQFHMRCLLQIAGIKWQDMVPNTGVLEQCGTCGIEFHIKRAQLRWSGHLVRMNDDRIPKALFYGQPKTGCRRRGGQRKRYDSNTSPSLASHLSHRSTRLRAETITINQRPENTAKDWSTSAGTCDHL